MGTFVPFQGILNRRANCATAMKREQESMLFPFTLKHSIFPASVIGLLTLFYAYVAPGLAP